MEGHGHDTVSEVKSFLYAITMVNVYVDVEDPWVVPVRHTQRYKKGNKHSTHSTEVIQRSDFLLEELQYTDDDVIDITKARRLQTQKLSLVLWPFTAGLNVFGKKKCHLHAGFCSDLKFFGMMQTSSPVDGNVTDLEY